MNPFYPYSDWEQPIEIYNPFPESNQNLMDYPEDLVYPSYSEPIYFDFQQELEYINEPIPEFDEAVPEFVPEFDEPVDAEKIYKREQAKKYYQQNREKILQSRRKTQKSISAWAKTPTACPYCHKVISQGNLARHIHEIHEKNKRK